MRCTCAELWNSSFGVWQRLQRNYISLLRLQLWLHALCRQNVQEASVGTKILSRVIMAPRIFALGAALAAAWAQSPIQLVRPSSDHTRLEVNEEVCVFCRGVAHPGANP